jgi:hypothetical protein
MLVGYGLQLRVQVGKRLQQMLVLLVDDMLQPMLWADGMLLLPVMVMVGSKLWMLVLMGCMLVKYYSCSFFTVCRSPTVRLYSS